MRVSWEKDTCARQPVLGRRPQSPKPPLGPGHTCVTPGKSLSTPLGSHRLQNVCRAPGLSRVLRTARSLALGGWGPAVSRHSSPAGHPGSRMLQELTGRPPFSAFQTSLPSTL